MFSLHINSDFDLSGVALVLKWIRTDLSHAQRIL
jgi:hypothetical protein